MHVEFPIYLYAATGSRTRGPFLRSSATGAPSASPSVQPVVRHLGRSTSACWMPWRTRGPTEWGPCTARAQQPSSTPWPARGTPSVPSRWRTRSPLPLSPTGPPRRRPWSSSGPMKEEESSTKMDGLKLYWPWFAIIYVRTMFFFFFFWGVCLELWCSSFMSWFALI